MLQSDISHDEGERLIRMDTVRKESLIFIIEDEAKMRDILRINLSHLYNIRFFSNAESAYDHFFSVNAKPELIITDVRLPGMDGIAFIEKIKKTDPGIPFIVFTGYGSVDHAVSTMKKGVFDYIQKPIKIESLIQSINRALSYIVITKSTPKLEKDYKVSIQSEECEFVTRDPATLQMLSLAQKAAKFRTPILIIGETGTGKELVARFIHDKSGRKGPFVKLNCASIPIELLEGELFGFRKGAFTGAVKDYAGKIALSDGGTLFLDEVAEMPLEIQSKLLHVLEIPEYYPIGSNVKKTIDLRIVTATNKNLRKMVDEEEFRHDLYYRIAVIPIQISPLRERKCDIFPVIEYLLGKNDRNCIVSPEVKLRLLEYSWPGNVRELMNVIERALLLAGEDNVIRDILFDIDSGDPLSASGSELCDEVPGSWQNFKAFKSKAVKNKRRELEKIFIEKLLISNNGNVSASARAAGIDRRQLQDMIKSLNLDVSLFKMSED
jgi:DNA-binding NtrC family response regulator